MGAISVAQLKADIEEIQALADHNRRLADSYWRAWVEAEKKLGLIKAAEEAFAIRVLGQEKYDNSPCQAHPLELVEQEIEELREALRKK